MMYKRDVQSWQKIHHKDREYKVNQISKMLSRLGICQLSSMRTSVRPAWRMMGTTAVRSKNMATNMRGSVASPKGKRTGKVLAEGSKAEESLQQRRVHDNWKGYKSLVDKGSKVEAEQARPDDSSWSGSGAAQLQQSFLYIVLWSNWIHECYEQWVL